jgi:predicted SAM-dependent methyltransferase
MEKIKGDARWGDVFKAPWNGYCRDFLWMLYQTGMSPAVTNLVDFPMPMPAEWKVWSHRCALLARDCSGEAKHKGHYLVSHPMYRPKRRAGARRSEISPRNIRWWKKGWNEDTDWAFCEDLLRPALLKLHLGCGTHVFDGWANLDPRSNLHPDIINWDYSRLIPFSDNKADICLTSHTFNYIEESFYEEALLDIWRVLRPGGILRMQEDRTDSGYIWRYPGQGSRNTGEIKSLPTKERIWEALENVGFKVYTSSPGETKSPHKDVIQGDSRLRRYRWGQKFFIEAVKDENINLSKVRMTDRRATVDGRYTLGKEVEECQEKEK